ncbi:MAG TPA: DUF2946 family protein [Usitatibacter sp.]|nr:DUF2946 family protein [Usitatibacter sp.]
MRRFRRWFALAWLGAALTALSPVLAYAHGALVPGGLLHEHCAGDSMLSPDPDGDPGHPLPPADDPAHPDSPHCPYCPGFAAVTSAPAFAFDFTRDEPSRAPRCEAASPDPSCRPGLRLAESRAPPSLA